MAASPPGGLSHSPVHGGAVAAAAARLGIPPERLLDFSASINPLGMPEAVRRAAVEAVERAIHYPPPDGSPLVLALARHHRLPGDRLLAGGGSTELIFLLPLVLRPRRALVVTPAFCEYERALALAGARIDRLALDPGEDFALDPQRLLGALSPETDLVVLANPGNPSGAAVPPGALAWLAGELAGRTDLLVDEAFIDFCPERSLIDRVADLPNLWVLRSLTKFYAIPGLRCGYLAGPSRGIERLAAARIPWSLSTPALAAARACLEAEEFRARTLERIPTLRTELREGLAALDLRVFPSAANYLLAHLGEAHSARDLAAGLESRGLLIRTCDDFHGLDDRYFRVAVRTADQNRRLLEALSDILQQDRENRGWR